MAAIEIKNSPIEGKGVFAASQILKGEKISAFQGEKLTIAELKQKYDSGQERIDDPFQIADGIYVDLEEPYIYFNHSCSPNAGVKGSGILFALRDISKGEEITYDYSTTEWTDDEQWGINWTDTWRIPCNCGSKSCRGEIRVFSLLPEKVKQNYYEQGALMDFIVARLDREKLLK